MRRALLPAASLWLALCGPAGPCIAAQATDPFDDIETTMRRLREELTGDLPKLQALTSKYGTKEDLAAIAPERQILRAKIQGAQDEFEALGDTYRELSKTAAVQSVTVGLSQIMNQAKSRKGEVSAPADAGAVIGRAMAREKFFQESNDFRRLVKTALAEDDSRYQGAWGHFAQRRRDMMILVSFIAALVVIISAFLYVFWWKSRALDKLITTYSSQPLATDPGRTSSAGPAGGLMPGTVLANNYRIDRELGRGGMGLVYEAVDVTLQRKVAIKAMRGEFLKNPKDLEMFLSEARLVASLKHPNIVEIHNVLRDTGEIFLVFEFMEGSALSSILSQRKRLTIPQSQNLLSHSAPALDYAHSRKVIHRDIKPANIMITREGVVKLMDFGIAHQARLTAAKLTRAESWGTPPYMAPEQELGAVSKESDIYALGVCLYETLTGKIPFTGPNFLAQKRERSYLRTSKVGLPGGLDPFFDKALHPEPGQRFRSGAEMLAAFKAV